MAIQWSKEGGQRRIDVDSGAVINQITSTPITHTNVYCEQPYASADGTKIVILRWASPHGAARTSSAMMFVADVTNFRLAHVLDDVTNVCNAAWSGVVFAHTGNNKLHRVNLDTCEVTEVEPPAGMQWAGRPYTVSPDQRYIVWMTKLPPEQKGAGMIPALQRVDLITGENRIIFQHPEMINPHAQFNPVHGRDLLVQLNRGSKLNDEGASMRSGGEVSTTHILINAEGDNHRSLPIGPPLSGSSTGHSNHVADTGVCIASVLPLTGPVPLTEPSVLHPGNPDGNLLILRPDADRPEVFRAPDHRFNHVSASRCGRYFVCDTFYDGRLFDKQGELITAGLVIGNLTTGRYRTLVKHTLASCANGQHTHPHAYFTADNRHVIFNADPYYAATQIFAAKVPDDFLASLD